MPSGNGLLLGVDDLYIALGSLPWAVVQLN